MGRTMPTFTTYLDQEMSSWRGYRRALPREDREAFDTLFRHAKKHIAEASSATRPVPFDALVMSVLLEQQKEIDRLKRELENRPEGTLIGERSLKGLPVLRRVC
jgi:hypothetical protein